MISTAIFCAETRSEQGDSLKIFFAKMFFGAKIWWIHEKSSFFDKTLKNSVFERNQDGDAFKRGSNSDLRSSESGWSKTALLLRSLDQIAAWGMVHLWNKCFRKTLKIVAGGSNFLPYIIYKEISNFWELLQSCTRPQSTPQFFWDMESSIRT